MNFQDYQSGTARTAIYPTMIETGTAGPLLYPALGLASEAGEVAGKIKKLMRDCNNELPAEAITPIAKELGGCLWYISELATQLGLDLEDIAGMNLGQLESRAERGTLQGSGDDR